MDLASSTQSVLPGLSESLNPNVLSSAFLSVGSILRRLLIDCLTYSCKMQQQLSPHASEFKSQSVGGGEHRMMSLYWWFPQVP